MITLECIRTSGKLQPLLGLLTGIAFGFLLQKGGVTDYGVILGQLLLSDFTVIRVMLTAVLVGMIGVFAMKAAGTVRLHCRSGTVGATVVGGLVFGAGFALLGYCPGTAAGAVGAGALDALFGMAGIVLGAGIYARLYPRIEQSCINRGSFPADTIPELFGIRPGIVVVMVAAGIVGILYVLAVAGL